MIVLSLLLACGSPAASDPVPEPAVEPAVETAADPAPTTGRCHIEDSSTWEACQGTTAAIEGVAATVVHNHPVLNDSPFPDQAPAQLYMDVGDLQVIVLTSEDTRCTGRMTATGTLRLVDLGGPEGTMGSYRGLAIEGASLTCVD